MQFRKVDPRILRLFNCERVGKDIRTHSAWDQGLLEIAARDEENICSNLDVSTNVGGRKRRKREPAS